MIGGAVTYFKNSKANNLAFSLSDFFLHIATSGFVGAFINYLMIHLQYDSGLAGAAAGIAGMFSHFIIKTAKEYVETKYGKKP